MINTKLNENLLEVSLNEPEVLKELRNNCTDPNDSKWQSSPEQAQFIAFLARLINAKKIIEIGIYKGYTTLALALACDNEGEVIACDINQEWARFAEYYWQHAGQRDKIKLKLQPALKTLEELINAEETNKFDLIFIDADKSNYDKYYEFALQLLRPGGLIIIDNTLWHGKVIDPLINDKATQTIRNLNIKLKNDSRIVLSMLPIRDGLTLVNKK